jgi:hypothetical protein
MGYGYRLYLFLSLFRNVLYRHRKIRSICFKLIDVMEKELDDLKLNIQATGKFIIGSSAQPGSKFNPDEGNQSYILSPNGMAKRLNKRQLKNYLSCYHRYVWCDSDGHGTRFAPHFMYIRSHIVDMRFNGRISKWSKSNLNVGQHVTALFGEGDNVLVEKLAGEVIGHANVDKDSLFLIKWQDEKCQIITADELLEGLKFRLADPPSLALADIGVQATRPRIVGKKVAAYFSVEKADKLFVGEVFGTTSETKSSSEGDEFFCVEWEDGDWCHYDMNELAEGMQNYDCKVMNYRKRIASASDITADKNQRRTHECIVKNNKRKDPSVPHTIANKRQRRCAKSSTNKSPTSEMIAAVPQTAKNRAGDLVAQGNPYRMDESNERQESFEAGCKDEKSLSLSCLKALFNNAIRNLFNAFSPF